MTDALRFEGVRLRTIASTYWTLLLGLLLCGVVALALGLEARGTQMSTAMATLLLTAGGESVPFSVMGFAAALVGIFATGHEYRYGTILPTLTAMPRRSALLAAKLMVVAAVSTVAALAAVVLCWLIGTVTRGDLLPLAAAPIPGVLAGHVVLVLLYGVLGATLGQLTRSIPVAVAVVLVMPLLIEPVISALAGLSALSWLRVAVPYLPFTAGMRLVSAGLAEGQVFDAFTRWEGGAVFAAFIAVLLALSWLLFERRDA